MSSEPARTAVPGGTNDPGYEALPAPWVDENDREWEVQYGLLIYCPACAFGFGYDHPDERGGYSCPNCDYDPEARADVARAEEGT